jgi:hypothetical protein
VLPSRTNTLAYYENSYITAVKSFTALASESVIQITFHKRHEIKIISGVALSTDSNIKML